MTDLERIDRLFEKYGVNEMEFVGTCRDCEKKTKVIIRLSKDGKMTVEGGAIYPQSDNPNDTLLKCDKCFADDPLMRTRCEVYSRVVGYYRPISSWNNAKQAEFHDRKLFDNRSLAA